MAARLGFYPLLLLLLLSARLNCAFPVDATDKDESSEDPGLDTGAPKTSDLDSPAPAESDFTDPIPGASEALPGSAFPPAPGEDDPSESPELPSQPEGGESVPGEEEEEEDQGPAQVAPLGDEEPEGDESMPKEDQDGPEDTKLDVSEDGVEEAQDVSEDVAGEEKADETMEDSDTIDDAEDVIGDEDDTVGDEDDDVDVEVTYALDEDDVDSGEASEDKDDDGDKDNVRDTSAAPDDADVDVDDDDVDVDIGDDADVDEDVDDKVDVDVGNDADIENEEDTEVPALEEEPVLAAVKDPDVDSAEEPTAPEANTEPEDSEDTLDDSEEPGQDTDGDWAGIAAADPDLVEDSGEGDEPTDPPAVKVKEFDEESDDSTEIDDGARTERTTSGSEMDQIDTTPAYTEAGVGKIVAEDDSSDTYTSAPDDVDDDDDDDVVVSKEVTTIKPEELDSILIANDDSDDDDGVVSKEVTTIKPEELDSILIANDDSDDDDGVVSKEVTTIQPTKSDSDEISDDDDDDDGIGENTEDDTSPTEAVFSSKLSETEPGEPDTELSVQPRDDSEAEEGVDSGDSATSDSGESEKEADVGKVVALDDADDDAADDGDEGETGDDGEDGDKVVKDEGIIDLEEAEKMFSEEDEEGSGSAEDVVGASTESKDPHSEHDHQHADHEHGDEHAKDGEEDHEKTGEEDHGKHGEDHGDLEDHGHGHGDAHHGDSPDDKASKKRNAIIVGVALGGAALLTLGVFTTRQCKQKAKFTPLQKAKEQNDPEAIEFRPVGQTGTALTSDVSAPTGRRPAGGEAQNGLFRHGPKMGPPSPRFHRKTEGKFQFPDSPTTADGKLSPAASPAASPLLGHSPAESGKKRSPNLSLDIGQRRAAPGGDQPSKSLITNGQPNNQETTQGNQPANPAEEPLMNGVDKLKYIDESTDDEFSGSVPGRPHPLQSHDQKLSNLVEEPTPASPLTPPTNTTSPDQDSSSAANGVVAI